MNNTGHKLNFIQPLSFLVFFILIVTALFFLFSGLSNSRKESVYQTYAGETQKYIDQNSTQLLSLFNTLFPSADCVANKDKKPDCKFPTQDEIAHLLPSTLKDWSSTAFLKNDGETILMMGLSGDTHELYIYPEDKKLKLQRLLRGEITKIEWDDYINELAGKEVIIPVKDTDSKVKGAIARSVIETR